MANQIYYFSNSDGEDKIRELLLSTFSELYSVNRHYKEKRLISNKKDFDETLLAHKEKKISRQLYLCPSNFIENYNDNDLYKNPIIEYAHSYINNDGIYCSGWISFYSSDIFLEIKIKILSLLRKIKKQSWRDINYTYWVFNIPTPQIKAFIPNREVVMSKNG